MRRILNYKPKKLREEIYKWCEQNIVGYKKEIYYKRINSAISKACKKGSMLVNVGNIVFYRQEMDYLDSLKIVKDASMEDESEYSDDCKKLLFTFIFLMKANKFITENKNMDKNFEYKGKYFRGGQKRYNHLKKLAKLPEKARINEDIINTLWINNLVTPMFNGLVRLDFMEDIYKLQDSINKGIPEICNDNKDANEKDTEKDIVLRIKDFDSVGWYFDYYNQDKRITFCKKCGKIFKRTKQKDYSSIYCKECAMIVSNEKNRLRVQKYRNTQ